MCNLGLVFQRSLLISCYSIFLVSILLSCNLPLSVTTIQLLLSIPCFKFVVLLLAINELLLSIPCFKFVVLLLAINELLLSIPCLKFVVLLLYTLIAVSTYHQRSLSPAHTQYSVLQVCCISTSDQQSYTPQTVVTVIVCLIMYVSLYMTTGCIWQLYNDLCNLNMLLFQLITEYFYLMLQCEAEIFHVD